MKTTKYKLSDIKPIGNFDSVLKALDKKVIFVEAEGYSSKVAQLIKLIINEFGLIDVLSNMDDKSWNIEEQKICLLYTHSLIIRLNNIAQKDLNNIEMEPINIQLMDHFNSDPKLNHIFGHLEIEIE